MLQYFFVYVVIPSSSSTQFMY